LRLKYEEQLSDLAIGVEVGVVRTTVVNCLERARQAGLTWPPPPGLSDAEIENRLFRPAGVKVGFRRRPEPDWRAVQRQLRRPGNTLIMLWDDYLSEYPEGYCYNRFCELYREFESRYARSYRGSRQRLAGAAD
jgi:transposase